MALVALILAGLYFAAVQALFSFNNLLVPFSVPLLVQLPSAFIAARLTRSLWLTKVVQGPCLVTDIKGSSQTSGRLETARLRELLEQYRFEVTTAVKKRSGSVQTPQVGDSVVCFWAGPTVQRATRAERLATGRLEDEPDADRKRRRLACMAALEIADAVTNFNLRHPAAQLPTRIGLHVGELSVARDADGELCTVEGNTVIVATRLQQLGKLLLGEDPVASSPRILTSKDAITGIDDLLVRCLGSHELEIREGKRAVYQILGLKERLDAAAHVLCERFVSALQFYESGRWNDAERAFRAILEVYPTDGPSQYFARKSANEASVVTAQHQAKTVYLDRDC